MLAVPVQFRQGCAGVFLHRACSHRAHVCPMRAEPDKAVCCLCYRFFARPLAELITSQGRDILQSTVDLVNDMGVPGLEVRPRRVVRGR